MIIGISGKKRSGKDTVADMLQMFIPKTIKYHFATPLKREVAMAMNVSVEYIDQHKDNFRKILQGYGTDYRRMLFGDDYWVNKMQTALSVISTNGSINNIIIPDVRFKNEYEFVKRNHGIMIRVNSSRTDNTDTHISETELDTFKFDYTIDNSGTLIELNEQVEHVATKIT